MITKILFSGVLLSALLAGCATALPKPPKSPTIVYVPVTVFPPAPTTFVPAPLAIDALTPADSKDYAKIATAYANSILTLKCEVDILVKELDAYKHPNTKLKTSESIHDASTISCIHK